MAAISMLGCAEGGSATSAVVDTAFTGSGPHHRTVATRSEQAQTQFDLVLAFLYAFNHDEKAYAAIMVGRRDMAMASIREQAAVVRKGMEPARASGTGVSAEVGADRPGG